ncbi:MAG: hypothetical protein R2853_13175 [Thermomicrobiales bacterium]
MRLPDVLLDTLGQSPDSLIKSRRSLLGGLTFLAAITGASQPASGKRRKRRKKKRCKTSKRCGAGCCSPDACFAESVNPTDSQPLGFACCPADKLCRSPKPPYPDQCCYPDETCQPSLTDNPLTQTICCRPCGDTCCLNLDEECNTESGKCEPANTARLARTRRPG